MNTLLSNLPNINFAEKDTAIIEAEVIARFEEKLGRPLAAGDPWRQVILSFVYYLSLQRNNIDFTGKQNLLKYAGDGYLQHLGALLGVEQLQASRAKTTLEFTLSTTLPSTTIIPKGTRATPGNSIFFATDEDIEIPSGSRVGSVSATCNQDGIIGNGFLEGQVNRLIDSFAFNSSVTNITITQGGADVESLEALRMRINIAPESFSTAGPYGSYEFWAKTANQLIIDVSVMSPSPGVVEIVPLLQGGEIPSQTILDEVYNICNDDRRRPLTDYVKVRPPEPVYYDIEFTYFIARSSLAFGLNLQQRVDEAVQDFILWQKSRLGRDINPTRMIEMVKSTGIKRIDMYDLKPAFTKLRHYELGVCQNVNVIYGGIEDD